jgi:hypothetical protein
LTRRGSAIALRNRLAGVTSDDEFKLFVQTAQAVLAMAGRNEFAASLALLEQARSRMHTLDGEKRRCAPMYVFCRK